MLIISSVEFDNVGLSRQDVGLVAVHGVKGEGHGRREWGSEYRSRTHTNDACFSVFKMPDFTVNSFGWPFLDYSMYILYCTAKGSHLPNIAVRG